MDLNVLTIVLRGLLLTMVSVILYRYNKYGVTFVKNIIDCSDIEPFCNECPNSICSACTGGKFFNGATCADLSIRDLWRDRNMQRYKNITKSLNILINWLDCSNSCILCTNSTICNLCGDEKLIYGPTCVDSCPLGTFNNSGVCSGTNFSSEYE